MRLNVRSLRVVTQFLPLAVAMAAGGCAKRPPAATYPDLALTAETVPAGHLRAEFLGVATVLLDDGETKILTDGFFTRPPLGKVGFGTIAPDDDVIARSLARAGVDDIAAVLVAHSHYDHALDSARVAKRTNAVLVGSRSTAWIATGDDFPPDRMKVVAPDARLTFGKFAVRVLAAKHSPDAKFPGDITSEVRPPAKASAYKQGECFSFLVDNAGRRVLVHPSANYICGAMNGIKADTVFLGVGALGKQSDAFTRAYWHELVTVTGAKRVVLIHWDDFFGPLDQPLLPMRAPADDLARTVDRLRPLAAADGVDLRFPTPFAAIDLGK